MNRFAATVILVCIPSVSAVAPRACAQGNPPGTVTITAAATGFHKINGDLDQGGDLEWSNAAVSGGVTWQLAAAFTAGISLRHVAEDWRFDSPTAFGGSSPWRRLNRSNVGVNMTLALSRTLLVGVSPGVEWAYEKGADTGDALTYGAVVNVAKRFTPDLVLGAGVSVFRQFYSVKVSPFAIINWKLSDRLRIANALSAGPEGGAGIEVRWTLTPDWELAGGGVIRSDRYRLADTGPVPGDIGEAGAIPLFGRLSRKLGPEFKADLYVGAMAKGHVRTRDSDGHEMASDDFATTPAIALTVSFKR